MQLLTNRFKEREDRTRRIEREKAKAKEEIEKLKGELTERNNAVADLEGKLKFAEHRLRQYEESSKKKDADHAAELASKREKSASAIQVAREEERRQYPKSKEFIKEMLMYSDDAYEKALGDVFARHGPLDMSRHGFKVNAPSIRRPEEDKPPTEDEEEDEEEEEEEEDEEDAGQEKTADEELDKAKPTGEGPSSPKADA